VATESKGRNGGLTFRLTESCLIDGIDCDRHEGNLSSALRVFVLGVHREAVISDPGAQKPYN
jgi:predicted DNA-binding ribbon-helix-helix protein